MTLRADAVVDYRRLRRLACVFFWPKLASVNQPTDPGELAHMAERLAQLRQEHRALDTEIATLQADVGNDELQVKRLKRRKLQLKDLIARLESDLIPDQPA